MSYWCRQLFKTHIGLESGKKKKMETMASWIRLDVTNPLRKVDISMRTILAPVWSSESDLRVVKTVNGRVRHNVPKRKKIEGRN